MLIAVGYDVKKHGEFMKQTKALVQNPPEELRLVQLVPTKQGDAAFAVWDADSVDSLRETLDSELEGLSEQTFYEVDESQAIGVEQATTTS